MAFDEFCTILMSKNTFVFIEEKHGLIARHPTQTFQALLHKDPSTLYRFSFFLDLLHHIRDFQHHLVGKTSSQANDALSPSWQESLGARSEYHRSI